MIHANRVKTFCNHYGGEYGDIQMVKSISPGSKYFGMLFFVAGAILKTDGNLENAKHIL